MCVHFTLIDKKRTQRGQIKKKRRRWKEEITRCLEMKRAVV